MAHASGMLAGAAPSSAMSAKSASVAFQASLGFLPNKSISSATNAATKSSQKPRLRSDWLPEQSVSSEGKLSGQQLGPALRKQASSLQKGRLVVSVEATVVKRRRHWPDARPLVTGKVTRKALVLIRELKAQQAGGPITTEALHGTLRRWVKGLSPVRRDLLDVIKALDKYDTRGIACQVMEWSFAEDWFEANVRDYTKLLERLGKDGRFSDMERVLKEMEEDGFPPDIVTYCVFIGAYGRAGNIARVEEIVSEVQQLPLKPDLKFYTSLIAAYGNAALPEKAEAVVKEMESSGIQPSLVTFAVLITAFGRAGRPDDAQRMFDHMQLVSGLMPDSKCFTALLNAYGQAERVEEASAVFQNMRAAGLTPDDMAIARLISAYQKKGTYREAVQLAIDMEAAGLRLGVETYTALILLFGTQGLVKQATEVFQEMQEAGVEPVGRTFANLFFAYAKSGQVDGAVRTLRQMKRLGWDPNEKNFELMVAGLEQGGLLAQAHDLRKEALAAGFKLNQDTGLDVVVQGASESSIKSN